MEQNIDDLVKTHRQRRANQYPAQAWGTDEEHHPHAGDHENEENDPGFTNPGPDSPVPIAEFLGHANLAFLRGELLEAYEDPTDLQYDPVALLKATLYKLLDGITSWPELGQTLATHPEDAKALGFEETADGTVPVPCGEWIRQFNANYLGNLGWEALQDDLVQALDHALDKALDHADTPGEADADAEADASLGEHVTHDATPLEARGQDEEAQYNDHYEVTGYKLDVVHDRVHDIPLTAQLVGINEDEGGLLVPQWERLDALGLGVETARIDGGYTSFANLAYAAARDVRVVCRITTSWVVHEDATFEKLRDAYHRYWEHPGFVVDPTRGKVVRFLYERGEHDLVGKWCRNHVLAEYEECPTGYREAYGERNLSENVNGRLKNGLRLVSGWRGRGKASLDRRCKQSVAVLLVVALTRAQHGVTDGLTSLQGLV